MTEKQITRFNWRPVLLTSLIVSIGQLSMGLVFPSLPQIAEHFSISMGQVQLLISVYLLGFGPSQFFYGPISDAIGRRKVLLFALVFALLGLTLIVLFQHEFWGIVVGRFVQGLGTGACAVLARASTRDAYNGEQLPVALSYMAMVASFTPVAAPVLGGIISHQLGWVAVFITLMCYILAIWILMYFRFSETLADKKPLPKVNESITQYIQLARSRYFISFASIGWANYSLVTICISLMPFLMQKKIGMTADEYSLWVLIPTLGLILGSFSVSRLRLRVRLKTIFYLTPLLQLFSAIWFIVMPLNPLLLMLGQFLMVLANGMAFPCAQTQLMLPYRRTSGMVAALSGGGQMLIAALVSYGLMKLGMSESWHLGMVIGGFALLSAYNIHCGFNAKAVEN